MLTWGRYTTTRFERCRRPSARPIAPLVASPAVRFDHTHEHAGDRFVPGQLLQAFSEHLERLRALEQGRHVVGVVGGVGALQVQDRPGRGFLCGASSERGAQERGKVGQGGHRHATTV